MAAVDISIIAGLGNPGARYACTRHNAGFMLLDLLAEALKAPEWRNWQGQGEYARVDLQSGPLFLLKPGTYMNNSGDMVQSFASFHKIPAAKVLVCADDMAIETGRIRMRRGGSSGGQRGLQDIISKLGTDAVPRLRIGVGLRPEQCPARDYVLSAPSGEERKALEAGLSKAASAVELLLSKGFDIAMNSANAGAA